jgi:lipopolysaccharide export system protein LptA
LKQLLLLFFIVSSAHCFSQEKKIHILNSEQTYKNVIKYPGAVVLNGNVKVSHEGILLDCDKALYYQKSNLIHAYGNVVINQGDTIRQTSAYTNYNGDTKKAVSWGDVVLTDPSIVIKTDTLHFDRVKQEMFYNCNATITDANNSLKSKNGRYFSEIKKFKATTNVVVSNPENKLESNNLDYFTESGQAYFYGPSTITTKESVSYGERGFYDTKIEISRLIKNAKIHYNNRIIEGDSIYSNKAKGFASSTGNTVITDTINKSIIKGGYAEFYQFKDSVLVLKKPVAITLVEKDSMFIHGDTLLITGKPDERIVRAFHHVKFFKPDMSGKCDSLHSNQKLGLTKLFKSPVIWSGENQITGDSIHLLSDTKTQKLDSIFIKKNAFIIQKDSIGYSQIKGKNMFGKFYENKLKTLLAKGNGEVVNYARNEEKELIAIMKMSCSNILFTLNENTVDNIKFLKMPDGKTYPPSKFPPKEEKLEGFIWRETERPITKDDIFIHDEVTKALPLDGIYSKD